MKVVSIVFPPETDEQTEIIDQFFGNLLRTLIYDNSCSWETRLSLGEFAYNCSVNRTTGYNPFVIMYGS